MADRLQIPDPALPASPSAGRFRQSVPKRLRAAGIHLALSSVIFVAALYFILAHWYPGFHFTVDGGWQGVRIMAAVDLVLGPLLTLIIFNPFKARKLIAFDLSCIGLIQLGALAWGFYAVHSQHPVAVTYSDGEFYSVTAEPIRSEKADLSLLSQLSDRQPALIYVAPPATDEEETRAALMEMMGSALPHEDPFFFRAFAPHWGEVKSRAIDAEARARNDAQFAEKLREFIAGRGGQVRDYFFFPFTGRYGTCTLAFNSSGELLGAVNCQAI